MARENFLDGLRHSDQLLTPPRISSDGGPEMETHYRSYLHFPDLWLTPKAVEDFDPADFAEWPKHEREELGREVAAFLAIAQQVPPKTPGTKTQIKQARKHLERVIKLVRDRVLPEWLEAQKRMVKEAAAAAKSKGWYVEEDETEVLESLLGRYKAPRLRIKTPDKEVYLNPVAYFGSGRRGIVDLIASPTYETAYSVTYTYKDGNWRIVGPHGSLHSRPFSQATLVNTITRLPHF